MISIAPINIEEPFLNVFGIFSVLINFILFHPLFKSFIGITVPLSEIFCNDRISVRFVPPVYDRFIGYIVRRSNRTE